MKLSDIKPLRESVSDFVVFKVSSSNTNFVYYGYSKNEDIKKAFLVGANRQAEPDRGDVRMINAAGGEDELRFNMEDIFVDELDAWMTRNDLRAQDSNSITGPTNLPALKLRDALDADPERVVKWKLDRDINNMIARKAMAAGAFSLGDLKAIVAANPEIEQHIKRDLDRLLYPEFKAKYLQ